MFISKNSIPETETNQNLFQQFVAATGLSAIFANNSMKRACKRAGVDPDKFSKLDVQKVTLEFERILPLYLPPEEVIQRLRVLQSFSK
jgi:hypothetical protein